MTKEETFTWNRINLDIGNRKILFNSMSSDYQSNYNVFINKVFTTRYNDIHLNQTSSIENPTMIDDYRSNRRIFLSQIFRETISRCNPFVLFTNPREKERYK